ncbi:MAG: MBL fold metallo-hydrolase [Balneolaceae bacterium]
MYFKQFFDKKLAQYAYLIGCQENGKAVVIDPMRDIDSYIDAAVKEDLTIVSAADTHIHADYISGLREFAERGIKVYASDEGDKDWKYEWLMNSDYHYELLKDGDSFKIGNITIRAWHTPGHTPEHLSYYVTDGALADEPLGIVTGDFVFVGDVGRPDLLESAAGLKNVMKMSARSLYNSVVEFREVPDHLQVWPGHGAGSACGKTMGAVPGSTAGYENRTNPSLMAASSEDDFVEFILDGQPEPPLYFARMKKENKAGPAVTGVPAPRRLTTGELAGIADDTDTVVLDTRERSDFISGHIPGSLLSPLTGQFNTVAGSYINEKNKICLVVDEHRLREAILDLYRVGLDQLTGYATPEDLRVYSARAGNLDTLEAISFGQLKNRSSNSLVLDVRKASEFHNKGHVSGAVNIAHTRLPAELEKLPDDKKIYVHCQTGARSSSAASLLKRAGFKTVLINDDFSNYSLAQD